MTFSRSPQIKFSAGMRLYENYHAQYVAGVLGEKDWTALRNTFATTFELPVYRQAFLDKEPIWNVDFAAVTHAVIDELDRERPTAHP